MMHTPVTLFGNGQRRNRKPRADDVVIRMAQPADAGVIARIAALDGDERSAAALERDGRLGHSAGPVLVAEVDGTPLAAFDVGAGPTWADPFAHTADLVRLLLLRADQLAIARQTGGRAPGMRALLPLRLP